MITQELANALLSKIIDNHIRDSESIGNCCGNCVFYFGARGYTGEGECRYPGYERWREYDDDSCKDFIKGGKLYE